MTDERDDSYIVRNPRYAGATPEMVGRALLRPVAETGGEEGDGDKPVVATAEPDIQSSI